LMRHPDDGPDHLYQVVTGDSINEIEFQVDKALSEGWYLSGNLQVVAYPDVDRTDGSLFRFFQAMYRDEDPDVPREKPKPPHPPKHTNRG
jgi:hypothetical protein